jgi:hypothetical protein
MVKVVLDVCREALFVPEPYDTLFETVRSLPVYFQCDLVCLYQDSFTRITPIQIEINVPPGRGGIGAKGGVLNQALPYVSGFPDHLQDPGMVPFLSLAQGGFRGSQENMEKA